MKMIKFSYLSQLLTLKEGTCSWSPDRTMDRYVFVPVYLWPSNLETLKYVNQVVLFLGTLESVVNNKVRALILEHCISLFLKTVLTPSLLFNYGIIQFLA